MNTPASQPATASPHSTSAPLSKAMVRRIVFSSSVGNALEWFDFLVYGYFATIIAKQFFPMHDEWLSTLLAIATFGISFLMRPLGAIVLGMYGDRKGRKAALTLAIALMMVGTFTMAVMPPYASIGLAAPVLILLARLVQGFAVGGEFGSATAFMVEHSASRRGYYASWQFASQGLAAITAAAFGSLLTAWMPPEQLNSWGWRLPFVFGLLVGPVGYYIRSHLDETPEFLALRKEREAGEAARQAAGKRQALPREKDASFSNQWVNLLLAVGIVAQSTVGVYVLQLYMPMYAVKQLHMPAAASFGVVVLNGGLQFLLSPVMGALSDRIGRIRIMLTTSILMGVLIYPMFALLQSHPTLGWLLLLQGTAGIFKAAYSGPMPALMSEIFPTQVRSTGLSIGYSIGVTIFGGFAPTIVETFIHLTGDKLAPSYYVLIAAVLSGLSLVVVAWRMRRVRQLERVQLA
ncbi:MFS transporter [Paraburkholderia fungorum]|uniref:MFS transporter n=1 Tax=Paraburkholderia fungorum TaxID=134537 RepID=A0AAP5QFV6_9BURK|nr:MFS transporter [Paraburkholderia fungorum]KFX63264.1 membrane protein [Burkholderia sp. K24]AJZ58923.1 sugar (and other) transporter family protein [Paraburkholderia fungorum]MBU7437039.1 MFS transporter [Paraburkholderia fungorum]MDT8841790.1 MFS transporter [Paraburkholderia fungorum]PRZ52074.1 MHS family proline/betaine transporter-like MFS transporter [Paraburkholderia fungorum]